MRPAGTANFRSANASTASRLSYATNKLKFNLRGVSALMASLAVFERATSVPFLIFFDSLFFLAPVIVAYFYSSLASPVSIDTASFADDLETPIRICSMVSSSHAASVITVNSSIDLTFFNICALRIVYLAKIWAISLLRSEPDMNTSFRIANLTSCLTLSSDAGGLAAIACLAQRRCLGKEARNRHS